MHKAEQEQIRAILVQAIANICRKGLTYRKHFNIEGLLGITLDDDEVFLINIKETVHNSSYLLAKSRAREMVTTATNELNPSVLQVLTSGTIKPSKETKSAMPDAESIALRRGKRRSSMNAAGDDAAQKKSAKLDSVEPDDIKHEGSSGGESGDDDEEEEEEELEVVDANDSQQSGQLVIKTVKKKSLWGRSRRHKSRKSTPLRAVPSQASQPVFPEQDATDLGHFLSMKPMLRDIDETASNGSGDRKDEESNQSASSLQIDVENKATDEEEDDDGSASQPQVYIDHCVDGELSDVLNLTGDSENADTNLTNPAALLLNGTEGYQCGLCEEIFDDQVSCKRHMRNQHKAKVSFTCELCGRRFWHHGDYTEHKAVFHEGPGGYPCEHCGKVLLSKRGLKEHTQHHTGEFPYYCIHCKRGFVRKFEYTGHMRKHHPHEAILSRR